MEKKTMKTDSNRHPCFDPEAKGRYGRVHLPVAPKCNIRCNYCDRKYDCVNESRPGVSSTILSPQQAVEYVRRIKQMEPRITVAGIAGPGDPLADPEVTLETLSGIRESFKDMILCLATNGLNLAPYVKELARLRVSHVTVTINAHEPSVAASIYGWVRDGKVVYRGEEGAALLLRRQYQAVRLLKEAGMVVKVNFIAIPGINLHLAHKVAEKAADAGADLFNCMAMYPNPATPLGHIAQPTPETMETVRNEAANFLPQMRHCTRCRADAAGLLGEDETGAGRFQGCLSACSRLPLDANPSRTRIAVATREGVLVNSHLGETRRLEIWEKGPEGYFKVTDRECPPPGGGMKRWHALARVLSDCKLLLVSGIGERPSRVLSAAGIKVVETSGLIEEVLRLLDAGMPAERLVIKGPRVCRGGPGMGC